jgi:YggT family protein
MGRSEVWAAEGCQPSGRAPWIGRSEAHGNLPTPHLTLVVPAGNDELATKLDPVGLADAFFLLADLGTSLQRFVSVFFDVYILLILVWVLTSWIRLPYALHRVQRFLDDVCEPYIRLFRRLLPSVGPLDLSPIVAIIVLVLVQRVLVGVIGRLL